MFEALFTKEHQVNFGAQKHGRFFPVRKFYPIKAARQAERYRANPDQFTNHMNRWRKNLPERNTLATNHHL